MLPTVTYALKGIDIFSMHNHDVPLLSLKILIGIHYLLYFSAGTLYKFCASGHN